MDYISPERSLEGTCGDPGPLFVDQDGGLLEHMDYHGEGIPQHESPALNEGLLVDPANQISYLDADSLSFMNDQIPCNVMKSASASPASLVKQAQEHHVHIESDMQNDAAEQNVHNSDSEAQTTPVSYDVHEKTEVVDVVLPPELHESSGNDTSNFQQETTHCDAYLGDSMLTENSSRNYQLNNSDADNDEIPNSSALQMENEDIRKLHENSHNEKDGIEEDQMNGRNSSPRDERAKENFNSAIATSYLEGMEQENLSTKNGISTPGNQWDSPYERSARLEKGTPSPDRRVSLPVERSPYAHSSGKLDSQRPAKGVGKLACSRSPPARRRSRSHEKPDTNRRRASSRELTPHARQSSPPEKKARKESRHGDGSPRRRSASPRRRASPKRRSSPRRRDSSPRRDSPPGRRDSPRRRDRSRSRSPSRKTDISRHRREHGKSRSRSPHSRDRHRQSPRRRHSPGRRSSPSSHRHHSHRRPWSPPANRKTGLGKPGRNLFVAGFSYATTERDLEKKFSRFGRVTSARVVRDKRSGNSRGFGFLSLERDEDADAAIRGCDETEWNGRIILVEKSKAPSW